MGFLVVISETGFPHSACLFIINGKHQWCGFKPKVPKMPYYEGYVDESDRTNYIRNSVKFEVDDLILEDVVTKLKVKYNNCFYKVLRGPDCLNLSVDAVNWCGLKAPPPPNISPALLIDNLKILNPNWLNY